MSDRLTLQDLVDLLSDKQGITKKAAESFIRELVDLTSETVYGKDFVRIKDLGTFKLTPVKPRRSVDVNTGEAIEIAAHYKLSFTPDKELREAVNRPFAHFESIVIDEEVSFEDKKTESTRGEVVIEAPKEADKDVEETTKKETIKESIIVTPSDVNPVASKEVVEIVEVEETIELVDLEDVEAKEDEQQNIKEEDAEAIVEEVVTEAEEVAEAEEEQEEQQEEEKQQPEPEVEIEPIVEEVEEEIQTEPKEEKQAEQESEKVVVSEPVAVEPTIDPIQKADKEEEKNKEDEDEDEFWEKQYKAERKKKNRHILIGILIVLVLALGYIAYTNFYKASTDEIAVTQDNDNVTITDESGNVVDIAIDKTKPESNEVSSEGGQEIEKSNNKIEEADTAQTPSSVNTEKGKEIEVQEKETMRGLGLKYYGNRAFWVYIYEENKDIISRPDAIYAGMKLILPPASKYGIDANNETSVKEAERLESKLFSKFDPR